MKKILALTLALILVLSVTAFAIEPIKVIIDGKEFIVTDVNTGARIEPEIVNGRTMVPFRAVFEALGAQVQYYGNTKTIMATKGNLVISLVIGKNVMNIQNVIEGKLVQETLDVAPYIVGTGYTLVPLRAISQALGAKVGWDGELRIASVNTK